MASLYPGLYQALVFLKHYTGIPEDSSLTFTALTTGPLCFLVAL